MRHACRRAGHTQSGGGQEKAEQGMVGMAPLVRVRAHCSFHVHPLTSDIPRP